MAARLRYPELAPEGYAALSAFGHYVNVGTALEPVLLGLVYLRASVLNGCEFCTELHKAELRKHHEPESRLEAVVQAPDSGAFTPREQAALRWTEVITRIDRGHAPDEEYAAVTRFFRDRELVDLTFAIANINAWNRMGVAFRPEWRQRRTATADGVESPRPAFGLATEAQSAVLAQHAEDQSAPAGHDDDGGKVAED